MCCIYELFLLIESYFVLFTEMRELYLDLLLAPAEHLLQNIRVRVVRISNPQFLEHRVCNTALLLHTIFAHVPILHTNSAYHANNHALYSVCASKLLWIDFISFGDFNWGILHGTS